MGVRFRVVLAFASIALAAAAATPAGAAGSVTRDTSIDTWLTARHLSISDVVVQTGRFNYAGPACPGLGWDCAPAGVPVIQAGVNNSFACTTSPCSAYQTNNGGDNAASCTLTSSDENASQACDFTQSNTTGSNTITVLQQVTQTSGFTQNATQSVTCSQSNGSGANSLSIQQKSNQNATANLNIPVTHVQDVHESVLCTQTSGSGAQTANVDQNQSSASDLIAVGVVQKQNTAATGPNLKSDLTQNSSSGVNNVTLVQKQTLDQDATSPVNPVTQVQGPTTAGTLSADGSKGGLSSRIMADSASATSAYTVNQTKDWDQDASTFAALSQTQDDRLLCCLGLEDVSQTPDNGLINMTSNVSASAANAIQRVIHNVKAAAKNAVTWNSSISFDGGAPKTETKTGQHINNDKTCTETTCNTAENPSTLRGEVRCEVPCNETAYKKETNAPVGGQVGGLFTFQNLSPNPAPDVIITFKVPTNTTLLSAPGCTYKSTKAGTSVQCKRGTGEAGGVRTAALTFKVNTGTAVGTTITLTGVVTTGSSAPAVSSSALVHVV
jgi:hypothetical protein